MNQRIFTLLVLLLTAAFCQPVVAGILLRPATNINPMPIAPVFSVTMVNPQVLKLEAGGPEQQVTVAGTNLDKVTVAQIFRNNLPATGMSVQLLGGPPASRQIRITALQNAVTGSFTLRLIAGPTRIDVPSTIFQVVVTTSVKMSGGTSGAPAPGMVLQPKNMDQPTLPGGPVATANQVNGAAMKLPPPPAPGAPPAPQGLNLGDGNQGGSQAAGQGSGPPSPDLNMGKFANRKVVSPIGGPSVPQQVVFAGKGQPPLQPMGSAASPAVLQKKLEINFTGSLVVTSPGAGDSWCVEKPQDITWTSKGTTYKDLKITLVSSGFPVKTIAENVMVLDKSFTWDVAAALGTYRIMVESRDSNGLTIKDQSEDFTIAACGNVAALAAANAGALSAGMAGPGAAITMQGARPQIKTSVTSVKADLKLLGATLKGEFVPGSVDISGATLARADGGLWLSHDGHTVQAKTIEAEIVCKENSSLTRANVFTDAAPKGAEMRFGSGGPVSQRIQFNFVPLVTDAILTQLCPEDRQTSQMPFRPLVQAEWVCETETTVEVKTQGLGNYPATINCDMTEATASSLELWRYKYECPQGFVIEGSSSSAYVSAGNTREADKNCVRR